MRDIVKAELASTIPVVVYVSPSGARAASAGVFVTMAAHVAAMAPGTNIGAAHPVQLGGSSGGKEKSDAVMEAKMANDAVAYLKAIAARRGRNVEWAEATVARSSSVPVAEALKLGVVDLEAESLDDLLSKIDGKKIAELGVVLKTQGAPRVPLSMSRRQRLLAAVADPNVAMILMSLGVSGLLIELYNPGLILPGIVGALSLILAFYSFQTLSASYAGVLLLLFGVVLYLLEIKIVSHGLLALGGTAAMLFGALMLFKNAELGVSVAWSVILSTVGTLVAVLTVLLMIAKAAMGKRSPAGLDSARGQKATVVEALSPEGKILWQGELWRARCDEGTVPAGAEVAIESVEGLLARVRRAG
jgi:membrane-bound serine protease (ClpP class)